MLPCFPFSSPTHYSVRSVEKCLLDMDDLQIMDISSRNALNILWDERELNRCQSLHLACFLTRPQERTVYILRTSCQPRFGEHSSAHFLILHHPPPNFLPSVCSQDCSEGEAAMVKWKESCPMSWLYENINSLVLQEPIFSFMKLGNNASLLALSEGGVRLLVWEHAIQQTSSVVLGFFLLWFSFLGLGPSPMAPNTSSQMYLVHADSLFNKLFVDVFTMTLPNEL